MKLILKPLDVWLFRDGKPFNSDGARRAESVFPPYPSVIQGAIRSYQLNRLGISLSDKNSIIDAIGTDTDYKNLRIRGPFVVKKDGAQWVRYFPQPADAFSVDVGNHIINRKNIPKSTSSDVITNIPDGLQLIGCDDNLNKGESGLWLTEEGLERYLQGEDVAACKSEVLYQIENRPGIGMDNERRSVKTGLLFDVAFIRVQPEVGLYLEVEGYDGWPHEGVLQLGGESRAAYFTQISTNVTKIHPPTNLQGLFKVYFATPAFFTDGWTTDWKQFFDKPVNLVAVAVNRYESRGGFSYESNSHKPANRYIPAGSVYYFSADEPVNLIQPSITDSGAEIGFGQIIIHQIH